ncbi:hypothetical protein DsansV1_C09g0089261 [Dioscorea sansibarensis]
MMMLDRRYIDIVLVPSGLVIMFGYHLFLLYRILKLPHTTVVGYENHNKLAWVERMMQVGTKCACMYIYVLLEYHKYFFMKKAFLFKFIQDIPPFIHVKRVLFLGIDFFKEIK